MADTYSKVSRMNLDHALANDCTDPDCEVHVPSCIEDDRERLTAMAWYYAGACALLDTINNSNSDDEAFDTLTHTIKEVS